MISIFQTPEHDKPWVLGIFPGCDCPQSLLDRDTKIKNHPDLKDRIKWLNFIIPTMTVKYPRTMEANEHYSFNLESVWIAVSC